MFRWGEEDLVLEDIGNEEENVPKVAEIHMLCVMQTNPLNYERV